MLVDFRDIVFVNINLGYKNILYAIQKKFNLISTDQTKSSPCNFNLKVVSGNGSIGSYDLNNRCKNRKLR